MLTGKRTKRGWLITANGYSPHYRAMMQGARIGYRALYYEETLRRLGIDPKSDPMAYDETGGYTQAEWLDQTHPPDRVLAYGGRVQ